jgi:DNA primase
MQDTWRMSGRIPQSFIDELLNRVDIVDVIDSRVPLKKGGRDYMACCPFHDEKTPSFTVSPNKQFYHCFGCGAHGTAIGFLMEHDHMGFIDAVEELASMVNMEVPREAGKPRDKGVDALYPLLERASHFFRQQLRDHPQGSRAVGYLKQRGLSGDIARDFGIGFAPPGWDNLAKALGQDSVTAQHMIQAGLSIQKDAGGSYDRFRDRIMFPIRDRRGRVIGFGGRRLDDEDSGPKYLNSPETPVFHKGRELYGLYEARQAVRHPTQLLVVEGYMDVVALAQYGIRYAVATLGTATTPEHLQSLFRIVPRVVYCFDGDRAGREAAWRALQTTLPFMSDGHEALFLFLPEGEDPDSLVRKLGTEAFEQLLADAMPLSRVLLAELKEQCNMDSTEGRARLLELARPLLDKIPAGAYRIMLNEQLASLSHLSAGNVDSVLGSGRGSRQQNRARPGPQPPSRRTPVRVAISLLLNDPGLANLVENPAELVGHAVPGQDLLRELLESIKENPHISLSALLERWRDRPECSHLMKLAAAEVPGDEDARRLEFEETMHHLVQRQRESRLEELQHKLQTEGLNEDEKSEWRHILNTRSAKEMKNR